MTRPKQIALGIAVLGCAGGVVFMAAQHVQALSVSSKKLMAHSSSPGLPGRDTPEGALRSLGWAADKGDLSLIREVVTPEIQKMLDNGGPHMPGHATHVARELSRAQIVDKEVLSDEQVMLNIRSEAKDFPRRVLMQKVDNVWKLAALLP